MSWLANLVILKVKMLAKINIAAIPTTSIKKNRNQHISFLKTLILHKFHQAEISCWVIVNEFTVFRSMICIIFKNLLRGSSWLLARAPCWYAINIIIFQNWPPAIITYIVKNVNRKIAFCVVKVYVASIIIK